MSKEQAYNADETVAFRKVLPGNIWVHTKQKSAPKRKTSKDRVTFMPCSNAARTHKLPTNPRAFIGYKIPVVYKATSKGWIVSFHFFDWFKNHFIPEVKGFLTQVNRPLKAFLTLDNGPSHPKTEEINIDPNSKVLFLTLNCTTILPIYGSKFNTKCKD